MSIVSLVLAPWFVKLHAEGSSVATKLLDALFR
jgi:hypothetical protein